MPIPSLSSRTTSPQSWKKRPSRRRLRSKQNFGKQPIYTGGFGKKLPFKITKNILALLAAGLAVLGIGGIILIGWAARDLPDPNRIIDRSVAQSTKIYDRTGENLLFDIYGAEKRTLVELSEIPEFLIEATLTAEDRNFYTHKGISVTGIIRSVFKNLTTGSRVGGSTLTQQLVKNAILSPEKTYTRKIKEVILSWQIERRFSKDDILQLYFNEIPYGSVAYGAEAAAQTYLGKSVKEISLAEAAILAALPQAPTYYSPYGSNVDDLFERQRWILDSMAELGYITEAEAELAKQEQIEFKEKRSDITAPHFVMFVREYLTEKYGDLAVEQGGLKVITTLDLYKQEIAEEVVSEVAEKNSQAWNANNASLVAIDAKTGQILAMVGSKDYFADPEPAECDPGRNCSFDPQVNATVRPRQPGSSFKPVVYTAALKKGYTPETVLYDVVTKFQNYDLKDYEPKNYDLQERGPVTIAKALAGSLNIPAVKAIYLTGVDNVIDLAEDLGYTTLGERSRFGLSLVLGGGEVKLLEHTNAFAVLAREGEYHPTTAILEVRDKDGNVLEEYKIQEKKVLATQTARQTNKMLSDNDARAYIFGQSNYLNLGARPVAAKTGTTNDYHDAWTVGYTPSLAVGVWVGNNDNSEMRRGADGSVVAAPIWHGFMTRVLGDTPFESFKEPEPTQSDKPVLNGSIAEGVKVKINKLNGKLATNQTPGHLVEERSYKEAHSILHYINKDDPAGNTPPIQSGVQHERWEEAVQRWANENNYITEQPPSEYDTDYNSADRPTVNITSPGRNQTISDRNFSASVFVAAPRGVKRVEYYLDNKLLKNVVSAPFNLDVFIEDPAIRSGFYQLRAVAYDSFEFPGEDSLELNFQLPAAPSALSWGSPTSGGTLASGDFPYTIRGFLNNSGNIDKIDIYYEDDSGQIGYINTARQFPGGELLIQWLEAPAGGDYKIYAEVTNKDGYNYKSDEVTIQIGG